MIIHLAPNAPPALRILADTALWLHIGGASLALAAGPVALAVRKGGWLHRASGNVFFVSMLTMSGVGALTAPFLPQLSSVLGGVFTFYLTATAWAAARRRDGEAGGFERLALAFAIAAALGCAALGWQMSQTLTGSVDGVPYQVPYALALISALAGAGDLSVIRRGGLPQAQRIARHIWRMCTAFMFALGSFAGQPKAQPAFLHGSPLLLLPPLVVLAVMIWQLVRTLAAGRARPREALA